MKLNEGITVVDTRFVGKFRVVMMTDGKKIRSAVLIKDRFEDFSMRDHDDVRTLWKLSKKYRGGEITETKQNEGHKIINLKDILSEGKWGVKGEYLTSPDGKKIEIPGPVAHGSLAVKLTGKLRDTVLINISSRREIFMQGKLFGTTFGRMKDLVIYLNHNKAKYVGIV